MSCDIEDSSCKKEELDASYKGEKINNQKRELDVLHASSGNDSFKKEELNPTCEKISSEKEELDTSCDGEKVSGLGKALDISRDSETIDDTKDLAVMCDSGKGENSKEEDELEVYMLELKVSLVKDKMKKKMRLLSDLEKEYQRLCGLADLTRPALLSLSCASKFTEGQIRQVQIFERDVKQRKKETDGGKDLELEWKKVVKERMREKARQEKEEKAKKREGSRRGDRVKTKLTKSSVQKIYPNETSVSPKVQVPENLEEGGGIDEDDDQSVESYQEQEIGPKQIGHSSLLHGVAEAMEKQKEYEKRKKMGEIDDDSDDVSSEPKKKKRKKKTQYDEEKDQEGIPLYSTWAPPVGQTGDGRTYLNEKFGY
eukprot:TRINITY_DN7540_c0_g1_i9.p1 TRINITY_DN7540_c0_g1~~TRINITY_DN7540_c0_g1_i9.p1  ORF type:complete len:370 (-),score=132.73 TRINITY_DN7540_c0_g1_i9:231-1340(-)